MEPQLLQSSYGNSTVSRSLSAQGANLMSTSPVSPGPPPVVKSAPHTIDPDQAVPRQGARWRNYVTPVVVVLLALAVLIAITRNWNGWEGGKVEQVTDDAYVRGDLTPLSTKVAGIVRDVRVSDFQAVHKGDVLVELHDDDYRAQFAQAAAGVEAAKSAIENNRRQKQLQRAKIDRALAGVAQAQAEISAAQAGIDAAQASLDSTLPERHRQETLMESNSTTRQKVEQAVSAEESSRAQLVS